MKMLIKNLISVMMLLIFWVLGWWLFKIKNKTTIIGRENIPKKTSLLFLSNHQSLIDSMLIGYALFSPWDIFRHYRQIPWNAAAWENFFKKPSRRIFCYFLKTIPAYRQSNIQTANRNIKEFKNILENGNLLLFFEGTRSRNGEIGACKYGPAKLVVDLQPVTIPIRISGMDKVMPINIGFKWLRIKGGQKILIKIGPAIKFDSMEINDVRQKIKNCIKAL
ncbi:MAG TPA: lysophospholipid acyltransferase family protein [bacterium]|nr:lysophospholipid acyltransferase family protein [bacterium]